MKGYRFGNLRRRSPIREHELGDPVGRMGPEAHEHVLEIGPGLDASDLARLSQSVGALIAFRDLPPGHSDQEMMVPPVFSVLCSVKS